MKKRAVVDKSICVACGVCTKVCLRDAIRIYRGCYAQVEEAHCVGCNLCGKACPAGCISMTERSQAK